MEPKISAIAIIGKDGGIGKEDKLLWHLPSDLQYFKSTTVGHPIIMGRKTYESIGRALPKRTNIVLTRGEIDNDKIQVARNPEGAIKIAKDTGTDEVFIIGGEQIYTAFMPLVDKLYLSVVDAQKEADTFFPKYNDSDFKLTHSELVTGDTVPYKRMVLERVR